MRILVLNSGSSSIKFQLFNMNEEKVLAKGKVDRIGLNNSFIKLEKINDELKLEKKIPDHSTGLKILIDTLIDNEQGVINNLDYINAIGHRVVHGGEKFAESTLINDEVINQIEEVSDLAPLHNPHNLTGIKVCEKLMPDKPQVAVFDTAFHQTMPKKAYEYYKKYGIRRYGFHGTSHKYVANRAAKLVDTPLEDLKIITCHLGNGVSITAVDEGKSVDTSMGLTPLEGLMMGTRSGDIDPAIIPFLMDKENLSVEEMDDILNKQSGFLGVSGISSDTRDIRQAARDGDKRARIALDLFNYRVKKYIGAYTAVMGDTDIIVFTAGIGEHAPGMRRDILSTLDFLDFELDDNANGVYGDEQEITKNDSNTKVFVIPTNEELVIARDTKQIVNNNTETVVEK